jgi:hypothetical protein
MICRLSAHVTDDGDAISPWNINFLRMLCFYQTMAEVQSTDTVIYYNFEYNSLTFTGPDCTMVLLSVYVWTRAAFPPY